MSAQENPATVRTLNRGREASPRRVKIHRCYTIDELARVVGAAKGTVRRWIKSGLPALRDQKPMLVLGEDVLHFLSARKRSRMKCKPDECYCVKCRAPRRPAGDMAEFVRLTDTTGNLRGICPDCGSLMHKRIRCDAIEPLRAVLDVTIAQAVPSLKD
jgi:excisionase family DNA binding protein